MHHEEWYQWCMLCKDFLCTGPFPVLWMNCGLPIRTILLVHCNAISFLGQKVPSEIELIFFQCLVVGSGFIGIKWCLSCHHESWEQANMSANKSDKPLLTLGTPCPVAHYISTLQGSHRPYQCLAVCLTGWGYLLW